MRSAPNQHAVSVTAKNAPPAFQAMMRIGRVFHEFDSDSTAMVIFKGSDEETDCRVESRLNRGLETDERRLAGNTPCPISLGSLSWIIENIRQQVRPIRYQAV
jgi:uncharacterized membrane protein YdfJ with MMPL/SSD domain